jgi:hypothetical protein
VIENAIVGIRARVDSGAVIKRAMVMGADFYESEEERKQMTADGRVTTRTPAHLHTRTPAHPHTRTPAHPHTRTPVHP